MALATMLGRARILQIAAISRHQKLTPNFTRFSRIQQLSIAADENLIRFVEDRIDRAPKPIGIPIPDWFPFKIYEDPERSMAVVLRRNFCSQEIEIKVDSRYFVFPENRTDELHSFWFVVKMFKPKTRSLWRFNVDVGDNGNFEITGFNHARKGRKSLCTLPGVSCLGNKLTKTFGKYLEDMEICDKRTLEFLYEYIADMSKKEDLLWLNKMKKFLEN